MIKMENNWNWLKSSNKSIDISACDTTECTVVIDLQAENDKLKAENTQLKEWLENKEKACNHLRDVNARKKEQIKNLNYMLFEEKEMTTQEWKLKYRLANKERKFIQYKEITNNKLNSYKQALEEVREWLLKWQFDANIIKHTNEPLNKINEVLE